MASAGVVRVCPQLLATLQQRAAFHAGSSATSSLLHYDEVHAPAAGAAGASSSSPPQTVVVLHGLLGTGRNLRSAVTDLCRQAAARSGLPWRALLLDLRNHGKSAALNLHPPHTLAAAARDVIHLFQQAAGGAAPAVLVGHSMGGKTSLEVVRQLTLPHAPPLGQPKQVWVLDARPNAVHTVDKPTKEVLDVLAAVKSIPLPLASRQALYQQLQQQGFSPALQQWLGGNLSQEGRGRYTWTFNLEGAESMFQDYMKEDYAALLQKPPPGVTLNILRALRSDRWDHDTMAAVRQAVAATAQPAAVRGQTRYWELADAGHWVHADNPKGLVAVMLPSLLEAAGVAAR
ncbi:hypothetical protein ABPG75_013727 [Micractinium tetrahymenae]